jgi:hypothetical protein
MQRPFDESAATTRAGSRGRQLAAAFAVLVAMNVALGLVYIFRANQPPRELQKARAEALRQQLQSSVEKSAVAAFPPPNIGMERVALTTSREKQDEVAKTIIDAATKAGGSGTRGLPNDSGGSVLVIVPATAEPAFWKVLTALGAPPPAPPAASPAPSPNESVRLEVVLSSPP